MKESPALSDLAYAPFRAPVLLGAGEGTVSLVRPSLIASVISTEFVPFVDTNEGGGSLAGRVTMILPEKIRLDRSLGVWESSSELQPGDVRRDDVYEASRLRTSFLHFAQGSV